MDSIELEKWTNGHKRVKIMKKQTNKQIAQGADENLILQTLGSKTVFLLVRRIDICKFILVSCFQCLNCGQQLLSLKFKTASLDKRKVHS